MNRKKQKVQDTMNDLIVWLLNGIAGLTLGIFFFGGLWWTLRQSLVSPRPLLWQLGSLLLRFGVVLSGFYFVADGMWQRMFACLAGFVVARIMLLRLLPSPVDRHSSSREASHASRP